MSDYATVDDVITLWRTLTADEVTRTEALLPIISDELRVRASFSGRDLDAMIEANPSLASVAKEVTVSVISRILRQSTTGEVMSQESQSGLGYSWSGTYAVPGGGIGNAILPSDLKRLGLKRPRIGIIDFYDPRNDRNAPQAD
jgi:hypothetical protein